MTWNILPVETTGEIAEVAPILASPNDLEFSFGSARVDRGMPLRITGIERTEQDEWFVKVRPGVGQLLVNTKPWDPPEVNAINAGRWDWSQGGLPGADYSPFNLDELYLGFVPTGLTAGTGTTEGLLVEGTVGTLACETITWYGGWKVNADLPSEGSKIWLLSAFQILTSEAFYHGLEFKRVGDDIFCSYLLGANGAATAITLATVYSNVTGPVWLGEAPTIEGLEYLGANYTDYSKFWIGGETWSLSEPWQISQNRVVANNEAFVPQLVLYDDTVVYEAHCINVGPATCVYSLPDYENGLWDNSTRLRDVLDHPKAVSSTEVELTYVPYGNLTLDMFTFNGVISADTTVLPHNGTRVQLPFQIGADTTIEATYTIQDFEYTYRGYTPNLVQWMENYPPESAFQSCDLNPKNIQSPLNLGEPVYIYARPSSVSFKLREDPGGPVPITVGRMIIGWTIEPPTDVTAWRKRPSRIHGVTHSTEVINSEAVQMIGYVREPADRKPFIKDLRTPPMPTEQYGVWNPERSFEGPAYPEAGVVVFKVPNEKANAAREAANLVVPAGIIPLIEGQS